MTQNSYAGNGESPHSFDLHELREFAGTMRRVLEPGLPITEGAVASSAGACLHAAVLLVTMLEQFGMCRSRVRGGSGEDGFGARLPTGEMRGHYWVEAALEDEEVYTVDVTADQFGFGTVVILDAESSLLRYRAGPQEEVEEAAMDLAAELGAGDLFQKSRCRWETKSGSPERQLKWVRG